MVQKLVYLYLTSDSLIYTTYCTYATEFALETNHLYSTFNITNPTTSGPIIFETPTTSKTTINSNSSDIMRGIIVNSWPNRTNLTRAAVLNDIIILRNNSMCTYIFIDELKGHKTLLATRNLRNTDIMHVINLTLSQKDYILYVWETSYKDDFASAFSNEFTACKAQHEKLFVNFKSEIDALIGYWSWLEKVDPKVERISDF
jgi:hypothetical protein